MQVRLQPVDLLVDGAEFIAGLGTILSQALLIRRDNCGNGLWVRAVNRVAGFALMRRDQGFEFLISKRTIFANLWHFALGHALHNPLAVRHGDIDIIQPVHDVVALVIETGKLGLDLRQLIDGNLGEYVALGTFGFALRPLAHLILAACDVSAKMVSDMLGTQTLLYDGFEYQQAAKREKWNTAKAALLGDDITATGYDYAHFDRTSQHRTKQARPLMTPDEVLRMGEDEQILFISGLGLNPIRANKYPYFDRRENAGRYLPNPYHPPVDKVRIKTRLGHKWARVIEGLVPPCWASFPQYSHGRAVIVKGYPLQT